MNSASNRDPDAKLVFKHIGLALTGLPQPLDIVPRKALELNMSRTLPVK